MADTTRKTNLAFGVENNTKAGLNEIKQDINAVGETAAKAGQKASTSLDGLGVSADKNSEKVKGLGDQTTRTGEQIDRTSKNIISSMQRELAAMEAGGRSTAAYYEAIARQRGADLNAMKPYLDQMRLVEAQSKQALGTMQMSAAQTTAALRNVPAQFTDIVVSLQSGQAPLTVLLQQGGQLKDMFGGMGNAAKALGSYILGLVSPYTLAATAIAAIGAAAYQGSQESQAFRVALAQTGNASGVTSDELQGYAQQIASTSGTVSAASAALVAMTQARAADGASLRQYTEVAMQWEKTTGQSVSEVAKNFAELRNDPTKAVVKLNEEMNFLTVSTYQQIKSLEEQGRKTEAAKLAQDEYAKAMSQRAKELTSNQGYIERGWNAITSAAKKAWDAMLNMGRSATKADTLVEVRKQIEELEKRAEGGFGNTGGGAATGRPSADAVARVKAQIAALKEKETQLISSMEAEKKSAAASEANAVAVEKVVAADKKSTKAKTEHNAELEKQRSLIAELGGLSTTFYKDWERLSAMHAKGKLSVEELTAAQAKLLAQQPFMKAQVKAEEEATKAKVKAYEEDIKAQEKLLEQRKKSADAVEETLRKAKDEEEAHRMAAQLGITHADALARLALARAEDNYQKAVSLGADGDTLLALQREIEARQQLIEVMQSRGVREANDKAAKELVKDWEKVSETVGRTLSDYIMGGGKDAAQYLKRLFSTLVLNPIVNAIVGSIFGGSGVGGMGGTANGALGMANNAHSLYSLYGAGAQYLYGGTAGASALSLGYANGVGFLGGDAIGALYAANGGWAGVPAGGGAEAGSGAGGAASMSWGAMAAFAIPFIAAYFGGMFKEEKMVGQGLTGELGGDMYGYQLMRESGGLFDGPDYRYVVAEKEIKAIDAKIEKLKTDNPYAHLGERGDARRDAELQKLYNQRDVLERNYAGAIDGSHGPIKMIQDAFEAMREDTAKRADVLGLDGDSIRAMKVALGVDQIHPDTGGKGLQLTGLSEQEAAAKIQQALAQANEEMARSVLGTWEEQTKEVTRVIWENVRIDGDGDTEQFRRVGREYKETVTEQVFVMGEYVREGETAVQALTRLSSSLVGVNSVFELLGVTLLEGSLSAADWASKLVDAVGSMDALVEAAGKYYDLYYSDSEKQAFVAEKANKGMADKGLDLRVGDADAKAKYRAMVEKAIADGDEEFLAWLLTFADDFAAGVDAATAAFQAGVDAIQEKLAEIQRIRDETLSTLGLSMDGLVDGFIGEINAGRGAQAGEWLADTIAGGFEQAIYGQAVNIIMSSIIDGVITPMVTAAMTGSVVTEAVSGAAIETMVANARAAADALSMLLNDPTFREGLEKVLAIVKNLGNEIGSSIAPQQSAQRAAAETQRVEAERAATQAAQERIGLENRLLQLQGNTAALRARELAQLDPANRAIQQQIWALEDAQAAQQEYTASLNKAQSAYDSAMQRVQAAQSTVDSIRAQGTQNYLSAAKAYADAQQRVVDVQRQAAQKLRDIGDSILDWVHGSGVEAGSDPRQQQAMAAAEYQRVLAAATAGDQAAMDKLTGVADQYLQAAELVSGGFDFAAIRGQVLREVELLAASLANTALPGGPQPTEMDAALAAVQAAQQAMDAARDVALAIGAPLAAQNDSLIAQYAAALQGLNDANAALAAQQAALDSIKSGVWDTSTKTGQVNSSVGNVYGATNSVNSSVGNVYGATNQVKTGVDYVGEQIRQLVMLNVKLGEIASSVRSLEVQNPDIMTRLYSIMNSLGYQNQAFTGDGYVRVQSQNRGGTASWFAQGGIVDGMTPFVFGGGQLGIMGEAGPEAIMPTQRMSNGDLGVRVQMPQLLHRTVPTPGDSGLRAELAVTNARLSAALTRLEQIERNTQGGWMEGQRTTRAVESMDRNGVQVYNAKDDALHIKTKEEST